MEVWKKRKNPVLRGSTPSPPTSGPHSTLHHARTVLRCTRTKWFFCQMIRWLTGWAHPLLAPPSRQSVTFSSPCSLALPGERNCRLFLQMGPIFVDFWTLSNRDLKIWNLQGWSWWLSCCRGATFSPMLTRTNQVCPDWYLQSSWGGVCRGGDRLPNLSLGVHLAADSDWDGETMCFAKSVPFSSLSK